MAIGANEAVEAGALLPARMLNEFSYCPRLFYIEWVQGEFRDNVHTVEGRTVHRRVDRKKGALPEVRDEEKPFEARSVSLSSTELGLTARIDLVEGEGGLVQPVDYKKGRPPENAWRAWEPERVQLCAYGLLLREHGYACEQGILYFAQTRERVEVPFDAKLVERTLTLLTEARATARKADIPPPLEASPKCVGCSLQGICLPDEVNLLRGDTGLFEPPKNEVAPPGAGGPKPMVRPIYSAKDDGSPLYVQEQGARLGLSGEQLQVQNKDREKLGDVRLRELSHVVILGNVQVSTQALRELFDRGIPVAWMSYGGWLSGFTEGLGHKNIALRQAQFRAVDDPERSLTLAKGFVRSKIANCRTMLRRNHEDPPEALLRDLQLELKSVDDADGLPTLLGMEGNAARMYFGAFAGMLKPKEEGAFSFDFTTRTRRPPRDPVNAMLSFAYSMLAKELSVAARLVGLDPLLGFYHQPRYGRPALALDLMEEFRPIIADSVVLNVVNTGVLQGTDFLVTPAGTSMKPAARKKFVHQFERRLAEEVTHPLFGYRVSYRRVLAIQCRLLARHLMGEIDAYPEFRTR